jgi:hypothetical protein
MVRIFGAVIWGPDGKALVLRPRRGWRAMVARLRRRRPATAVIAWDGRGVFTYDPGG